MKNKRNFYFLISAIIIIFNIILLLHVWFILTNVYTYSSLIELQMLSLNSRNIAYVVCIATIISLIVLYRKVESSKCKSIFCWALLIFAIVNAGLWTLTYIGSVF